MDTLFGGDSLSFLVGSTIGSFLVGSIGGMGRGMADLFGDASSSTNPFTSFCRGGSVGGGIVGLIAAAFNWGFAGAEGGGGLTGVVWVFRVGLGGGTFLSLVCVATLSLIPSCVVPLSLIPSTVFLVPLATFRFFMLSIKCCTVGLFGLFGLFSGALGTPSTQIEC